MALTNRDVLAQLAKEGMQPCEWDPRRDMPSRLKDPYHGAGTVDMVAACDGESCRVCEQCAEEAGRHKLLMPVPSKKAA